MNKITESQRLALQQQFPVTARFSMRGDVLAVDTTLVNRTAVTARVFNVLWEFAPNGAVQKSSMDGYVCVEGLELRIGRLLYPYPAGSKFGLRIVPHLSALAAGETLTETLTFQLPLREYSCYQPYRADVLEEKVVAERATMTYGLIVGGDDAGFLPDPVTGGFRLVDGRLLERMVEVRTAAVPFQAAVMKRKAAFTRF